MDGLLLRFGTKSCAFWLSSSEVRRCRLNRIEYVVGVIEKRCGKILLPGWMGGCISRSRFKQDDPCCEEHQEGDSIAVNHWWLHLPGIEKRQYLFKSVFLFVLCTDKVCGTSNFLLYLYCFYFNATCVTNEENAGRALSPNCPNPTVCLLNSKLQWSSADCLFHP
jgi:hypothetical protein